MGPGGNVELFSRCMGPRGQLTNQPTLVGNAACDAVLEVQELSEKLDGAREQVRVRIDDRIDTMVGRVEGTKFEQTLLELQEIADDIKQDIVAFTNDPECGREDMYDQAQSFYESKVENAKTFAVLITKRLKVAKETGLAISEAKQGKKALDELLPCVDTPSISKSAKTAKSSIDNIKNIRTLMKSDDENNDSGAYEPAETNMTTGLNSDSETAGISGGSAPSSANQGSNSNDAKKSKAAAGLKKAKPSKTKALKKVAKCTGELAQRTKVDDLANDFAGSILGVKPPFASGKSEESDYIYPFVFKCYGCAKGLKNGVKSIVKAAQTYATAPACATGVGCAAPAVSASRSALLAVRGSVRAGVSCTKMVKDGIDNWDGYKARWVELAGFFEDTKEQGFSTERLVASFKGLPAELDAWKKDRKENQIKEEEARVDEVVKHFKQAYNHLVAADGIRKNEVKPLKAKLGEMRLATFEENFFKLKTCWAKVEGLGNAMGEDVAEGSNELAEVLVDLEAVEEAISNVRQAAEDARQAAQDRAEARRKVFRAAASDLYQQLLGVSYGQPARAATTGPQLVKQVTNNQINNLTGRLTELKTAVDNMAADAVSDLGDTLEGLQQESNAARERAETIRPRLEGGLKKLRQYKSNKKVAVN
jgi:tRNA(Ser,Leu) C12 N-acetylase TAN1